MTAPVGRPLRPEPTFVALHALDSLGGRGAHPRPAGREEALASRVLPALRAHQARFPWPPTPEELARYRRIERTRREAGA